ncbi:hypothetical protein [Engelhardtia mirabilis]|uniref:Tetratricopeptide repeat protein n=1 Tax=Engelhardtia mirabilis TaxID=2528011 RepID=A0A518BFS3_9BACT|nr:hypothetical protein Pla133_08950 [Planctomycetes bacterium Pla133]QDV00155.1 hypothetical protein Pla86_08940 [Planctomycetes bacterium Pla86]
MPQSIENNIARPLAVCLGEQTRGSSAEQRCGRFTVPLAGLLLLALQACSDPGAAELQVAALDARSAGDFQRSVTLLRRALDSTDPTDPLAPSLRRDLGQALIPLNSGEAAVILLELAEEHPDLYQRRDYASGAKQLAEQRDFLSALDLVHAGLARFEDDSPLQALLKSIEDESERDPQLKSKLESLGYISK